MLPDREEKIIMMKDFTISNMLDLNETIAAELLRENLSVEVLPEIGEFIIKLGKTLDPSEYEKKGENVWIAKSATVAPTASITGPAIIGRRRRYVTVPLSAARPLLAKAQLWETPQSLRMRCSLIKCRFRIIIMLEMQYLGINPIWEPDRFVLM